jgi:hypothetical protein
MKLFKEYLAESEKTYLYRIRMVGDVPADFVTQFKKRLDQFAPVRMSNIKSTPVQAQPAGFAKFANQSVSSFDLELRYPAIEPQIQQLANMLGMDPNRIQLVTQAHDNSVAQEASKVAAQNQDLLKNTDFPAPDAEQKALSADYSAEPHNHAVLKNAYRSDFTVAGGRTPAARTTNDLLQGVKSPMSTIKRPPKPATGAHPRG